MYLPRSPVYGVCNYNWFTTFFVRRRMLLAKKRRRNAFSLTYEKHSFQRDPGWREGEHPWALHHKHLCWVSPRKCRTLLPASPSPELQWASMTEINSRAERRWTNWGSSDQPIRSNETGVITSQKRDLKGRAVGGPVAMWLGSVSKLRSLG